MHSEKSFVFWIREELLELKRTQTYKNGLNIWIGTWKEREVATKHIK